MVNRLTRAMMKAANARSRKPAEVSNIQPVKGVIGKKRMADLIKAVNNRNRRIRYQVKRLTGEYSMENYAKLARAQYLPPMIKVDFRNIRTIKDYNALIRMLEADKTVEWKQTRTNSMRMWLRNSIARSIWVNEEDDPEMFERIMKMSDREILEFKDANKDLIGDVFDYYVDDTGIDADDREYMWNRMRKALGLKGVVVNGDIITL